MSSRDQEYFVSRPIESMQNMLRVLAMGDSRLLPVVADGIFESNTRAVVIAFQRRYGLPQTGEMNFATWEVLVDVYEKELILQRRATALLPIFNPDQIIQAGEANYHMYLVQSILRTLHLVHGSGIPQVTINGILDPQTVAAVRKFQALSGLRQTGEVDKNTWNNLARQYTLAAGDGTIKPKPNA